MTLKILQNGDSGVWVIFDEATGEVVSNKTYRTAEEAEEAIRDRQGRN